MLGYIIDVKINHLNGYLIYEMLSNTSGKLKKIPNKDIRFMKCWVMLVALKKSLMWISDL